MVAAHVAAVVEMQVVWEMVLVQSWLGLTRPIFVDSVLVLGRVVAAVVQVPGLPDFLAMSVYLHTGEGLDTANQEVLEIVAKAIDLEAKPVVAGGDWQVAPHPVGHDDLGHGLQGCLGGPA